MTIHIQYPHNKPLPEARELAEKVAAEMKAAFGLESSWAGDVLNFQRSGVTGQLGVYAAEVVVDVKLGFLLAALKPKIESEVLAYLKKYFV